MTSCVFAAGGHVHLRAHRADGADQLDQPVDLGVGGKVGERPASGQRVSASTVFSALADAGPQRLADERHERMHDAQDQAEDMRGRRARLRLRGVAALREHRLDQLQIPVAEGRPDEVVERIGALVEAVLLDRLRDRADGRGRLGQDPAVDRFLRRSPDRKPDRGGIR